MSLYDQLLRRWAELLRDLVPQVGDGWTGDIDPERPLAEQLKQLRHRHQSWCVDPWHHRCAPYLEALRHLETAARVAENAPGSRFGAHVAWAAQALVRTGCSDTAVVLISDQYDSQPLERLPDAIEMALAAARQLDSPAGPHGSPTAKR